jgi:hypothetical protein
MRITPPVLGRLLLVSRVMAHRRVVTGDFGRQVEGRGGAHEVELGTVEDKLGITFTAVQLAAAGLPIIQTDQTDEVISNG